MHLRLFDCTWYAVRSTSDNGSKDFCVVANSWKLGKQVYYQKRYFVCWQISIFWVPPPSRASQAWLTSSANNVPNRLVLHRGVPVLLMMFSLIIVVMPIWQILALLQLSVGWALFLWPKCRDILQGGLPQRSLRKATGIHKKWIYLPSEWL